MTDLDVLRGGTMKVDNTDPPLRVQCTDFVDDPYNLEGYSAQIKIKRSDGDSTKIDKPMTVEQPERGILEYSWDATDTDTSGLFDAEIVVDDGSGSIITFPTNKFFTIRIVDGL